MMKLFSVFDSKAEAFNTPMFFQSTGVAIRSFSAAASDEKTDISRFAADYTLFELGEFDEHSGKFTILPAPVSLGNALQLKVSDTSN